MKISAVIVSRNDNYGGHLNERASYCLQSSIDTYDEVIYVDWNSPTKSLLYDISKNINFKGNLKHIVISPEIASILTTYDPYASVCCEVLGRNIGIRRATGDYIVSTNIDIIAPKRNKLEEIISTLEPNTFYTFSRRNTNIPEILNFHGNDEFMYQDYDKLREYLITENKQPLEAINDNCSLINCCGDFQIAPKEIWNHVKGFEEELVYSMYSDSNVHKKAMYYGYNVKALFDLEFYHIDHGKGGGGFLDGINKKSNDPYKALISQQESTNPDTWGFSDIEIEYETL
jgi:hypothetical protein